MKPTRNPTQKRRKNFYDLGPRVVPDRDARRVRLNACKAGEAAERAGGDYEDAYLEVYRIATGYYVSNNQTGP
jgi:hypothetical protein